MTISSCIRVSTVCPLRVWKVTLLKSRHWLQDPKDDEKKLIGLRLIRRLGGIPGALARRELHMLNLAKPDGYKLILVFLEKKGYKKDALDRRLTANRRCEAVARRPGQTLQDFFATENMACADDLEAGRVTCSSRVVSQMTRSITFTVSCTIPRQKDQEQLWILERFRKAVLRFYEKHLGTWIDTETPEHPWAGTQDL